MLEGNGWWLQRGAATQLKETQLRPVPKPGRVRNQSLIDAFRGIINRGDWLWCECPIWHRCEPPLDVCHVKAKGMGSGKRMDTLDNLVVMCRKGHRLVDHGVGQGARMQRLLRAEIAKRPGWCKRELASV